MFPFLFYDSRLKGITMCSYAQVAFSIVLILQTVLCVDLQVTKSSKNDTVRAICVFNGPTIKGNIYFNQKAGCVTLITGKLTGVPPGKHGFHIHQYGDLSNDCTSTGGHYNPDGNVHGWPNAKIKHVGDLGNVVANKNGSTDVFLYVNFVDVTGERSVIGRAIVLHEKADDYGMNKNKGSLKTGNAGSRIGCCLIGYQNY